MPFDFMAAAAKIQRDVNVGFTALADFEKWRQADAFADRFKLTAEQERESMRAVSAGLFFPTPDWALDTPASPTDNTAIPDLLQTIERVPARAILEQPNFSIFEPPPAPPLQFPDLQWGSGLSATFQNYTRDLQAVSSVSGGGNNQSATLGFNPNQAAAKTSYPSETGGTGSGSAQGGVDDAFAHAYSEAGIIERIRLSKFPWYVGHDLGKRGPQALIDWLMSEARTWRERGQPKIAVGYQNATGEVYKLYKGSFPYD